jgi:hypothetical protein
MQKMSRSEWLLLGTSCLTFGAIITLLLQA